MTDLQVNLYERPVGTITPSGDSVLFTASEDAIANFGLNSRALSASLPLQPRPIDASAFVGGLLPEGVAMDSLQRTLGPGVHHMFELISHVGRDVAGAVTFGQYSGNEEYLPLTDEEIGSKLDRAVDFPLGEPTGGSSLPGFQRKIALTRLDGQWHARRESGSSTHILKPAPPTDEGRKGLHSEQYALDLGRQLGLVATDSYVTEFAGRPTLVIERFDRVVHDDGRITRIHQEDMAQALGLQWDDQYAKFQGSDDAVASLSHLAEVADQRSSIFSPAIELHQLLRYVTFNTAIGNTDAHTKNYGMLRFDDGTATLTPLYDVAPLALGYDARKSNALWVNAVRLQADVTVPGLVSEAVGWGLAADEAEQIVRETLASLADAVDDIAADASIEDRAPGFILQRALSLQAGEGASPSSPIPVSLQSTISRPARPARPDAPATPKDRGQSSRGEFALQRWRDAEIALR